MKMHLALLEILLLILANTNAKVENSNLEEIWNKIEKILKKSHNPTAAVVLLSRDNTTNEVNKLIRFSGKKVKETDAFIIGSCSKSFTGLSINILAERNGSLQVNKTIDNYIDVNKYFKSSAIDQAKKTTISQLLSHTSGLVYMTKRNEKYTFPNKVGEYSYSNAGFNLLGEIVASASGTPYRDFIKTNIYGKLGMKNSEVGWKKAKNKLTVVDSFINVFGIWSKKDYSSEVNEKDIPSGFLASSIEDFGKYLEMYLKGNDSELEKAVEDMKTKNFHPAGDGYYGNGLCKMNFTTETGEDIIVFYHTGAAPTFLSAFSFIPDLNLAGGILINENDQLFHPAKYIISYFHEILAGVCKEPFKDTYNRDIAICDAIIFGFFIIGLAIVIYRIIIIVKIVKKIQFKELNKCVRIFCIILDVIVHIIIPIIIIAYLIILFVLTEGAENFMIYALLPSFVVGLSMNLSVFLLGGILKIAQIILFCKFKPTNLGKDMSELNSFIPLE